MAKPERQLSRSVRIERIMYLASLASSAKEVDRFIEPLRQLDSIRTKGDALTAEEDQILDRIEQNVKRYLLESEKLRNFTPETLAQHLYERVEAKQRIHFLKWRVIGILITILLASSLAYIMSDVAIDVKLRLAINMCIATSYMAGAYLFLTSKRKFSQAHQAAYNLYGYAFIAGSAVTLCNLLVTIMHKGIVPWEKYWYFSVVTYLTFAIMYLGALRLATLYKIRSLAMKWWWIGLLATVGMIILSNFSWAWSPGARSGVNSIGAFFAAVFAIHGGWLMKRVWSSANPLYKSPTGAMGLAMISIAVAWAGIVIVPLAGDWRSILSLGSSLLFIVCAFLLIYAGYSLSRLSRS